MPFGNSDSMMSFACCFGFFLLMVPTVLCIILFARLLTLKNRLALLEKRFADFAHDMLRRTQPTAQKTAAPETPPAPIPLAGQEPARPQQPKTGPLISFTPPASTPAKLRQHIEQAREHKAEAPAPAMTSPPTPTAPPSQIPVPPVAAARPPQPLRAPLPPRAPVMRPPAPPKKPAEPRGQGWEAYIFTKGSVVIGAISVALAAIFMVQMGIKAGYFGPAFRDWTCAIAGVAFIAVGQWRRRHEGFWSQGAIAAGVIAIFASVFAATTLHHFLDPVTGFILLAVATAAAVAMSLQNWSGTKGDNRGGILIATLGLIGGFITPILVNSGHDNVPGLFGYLLLLHIGLVGSTRMRGWSVIAAASVVLSSLWLIFWTLFKWNGNPGDGAFLGTFLLGTVVSLVVATVRQPEKWSAGRGGFAAMSLTWIAVGLGIFSSCLLLGKSHFDDFQWAFFAALTAGAFVLGRLRPMYEGMAWLASLIVLAMLTAWGFTGKTGLLVESTHAIAHPHLQEWLTAFGIASVLGAYACLWKSASPFRWALLGTLLATAYVGVAYWILPAAPRPEVWAYLPLAGAALLVCLAIPIYFRRAAITTGEESLSTFSLGILAMLIIAAPMAVSHAPLTAAWAALLPLTVLAAWRFRIPGLLIGLSVLSCFILVRAMMIHTFLDSSGDGRTLFWNPVVWTYGSILLATALSAWLVEKIGELPARLEGVIPSPAAFSAFFQAGATAAAFLLFTLLVRWHFHDGHLDALSARLLERGTFAIGWLALAATLVWLGGQLNRALLVRCGEVVAMIGVVFSVGVLMLIANPLWTTDVISQNVIFNQLLLVYGVPAALCGLLAYLLYSNEYGSRTVAINAGVVGLLLLTMMVTLQVRHGYAAEAMGSLVPTFNEWSTYAVAWMSLGVILLAIGMRFHRSLLQKAGLVLSAGGLAYAIVVPGLLMSPILHHQWIGDWPILNQLLYGYGTPILLAILAAIIVDPRAARLFRPAVDVSDSLFADWSLGHLMRAGIAILLFILTTTQIRQAFQHGFLDREAMTFFERGTYPVIWLALSGALLLGGYACRSLAARRAGLSILSIAIGFSVLICALIFNPLWAHESVGETKIFNGLLYAYGIPAAATGTLAWYFWKRKETTEHIFAWVSAIASLLLIFTLVSLQVQHLFRGDHLHLGHGPAGEFTTYSLAWTALGVIYLLAGILKKSPLLRWASLIMLFVTILKVFLFDMADLKDFERVLSFAGLGLSLMALAFIYQRYVFRKPQTAASADLPEPQP